MHSITTADDTASGVISQLIAWANKQPRVRAMLLTSTRANPRAQVDQLSDYDVVVVVADIEPFHTDRSWLQDFGQVLVVYWDPIHPAPEYGIEQFGNVTLYKDGLKIDFSLWPVALVQAMANRSALPDGLDDGYVVLLDKDGVTASLPAPTYRAYHPTPPTAEEFQIFVEEFFSDPPYVAKCLWRDELLPAKWCLDYDMKHVYLRRLLEWRVGMAHGWMVKTGVLGRGLKRQLPADLWAQLEETYAGAGIAENWAALFATMAFFRRVAMEVAEQLGYPYPLAMDKGVVAYVQKVQDLLLAGDGDRV